MIAVFVWFCLTVRRKVESDFCIDKAANKLILIIKVERKKFCFDFLSLFLLPLAQHSLAFAFPVYTHRTM